MIFLEKASQTPFTLRKIMNKDNWLNEEVQALTRKHIKIMGDLSQVIIAIRAMENKQVVLKTKLDVLLEENSKFGNRLEAARNSAGFGKN
jgi:hypothetical protein